MESEKNFILRGQKPPTIPVFQQESTTAPSIMMESPQENKSHVTSYGTIMNELNKTKSRISKILEDYDEERLRNDHAVFEFKGVRRQSSDLSCTSSEEGSIKTPLSSKDDYKISGDIPSPEEFSSAMVTANDHIKKLEAINNKILEMARKKAVTQLVQDSNITVDSSKQENKDLLKMYTDEAMKTSKLKKLIDEQDNELEQLRASYGLLNDKDRKQHDQLSKTSTCLSEANQAIAHLRSELNKAESEVIPQNLEIFKISRSFEPSTISHSEANSIIHVISEETEVSTVTADNDDSDYDDSDYDGDDQIIVKVDHKKHLESTSGVKKKMTKAFAQKQSKSMEKQLIMLEEVIIQSSSQIKISLKNKSELILQLNLDILQLCHGMYDYANKAVKSSIYLLGVKDAEKLLSLLQISTSSWESKSRSNVQKENMTKYLKVMIDATEKDVADLSIELEHFVKRKMKRYGKLMLKDVKECAVEIQNWLAKAIDEIQKNIQLTIHEYHIHLEENEKQKSHELHDTAQKIIACGNELKKIMEQANIQHGDYFIAIKDGVKNLLDGLTKPKSESYDATVSSILQTQEKIFSIVNSLRSSIAEQLKKKYKINFCSTSWRSQSFYQKTYRKMLVAPIRNSAEKNKSIQNPIKPKLKDLSHNAVSRSTTSKLDQQRPSEQVTQQNRCASLTTNNYNSQQDDSSNRSDHSIIPVQSTSPKADFYPESHKQYHQLTKYPSHSEQMKRKMPQTTRLLITPTNLNVFETTPQQLQRNPQSFYKSSRVHQYFKPFQPKYSNRTLKETLPEPQCRPISALNIRSVSLNDVGYRYSMNLATPRKPTEKIRKFSYPVKSCQNSMSNLFNTSVIVYNGVSEGLYHHSRILPEASVGPIHHNKFTGSSLPKWNQFYRAYQASSK